MSVPEWIVPMAATLTQERFAGPDWIFEGTVRLLSRNRLPQHWPELSAAIAALPVSDLVLDGEAVGNAYHVFDVLWFHGRSVTTLAIEQRLELLSLSLIHIS